MSDSLQAQQQRVTEMLCRHEKSSTWYRLRLDRDRCLVSLGIKDRHEIKHQDTFCDQYNLVQLSVRRCDMCEMNFELV